jgi:hypothetical protein
MNVHMHRWLDTLVSIAIVVIGLTVAGATTVLGT